jgi:hypothetical protein
VHAKYASTHGGRSASQAVVCPVGKAGRKRFVGHVTQIDYRADKVTHGMVQYWHPIAPDCQPEVWTNDLGDQIYFKGGYYTVTPHGIEDLDDAYVEKQKRRSR